MRIIFYGELRRRYGESYDMVSDTVADAVDGLARQLPDWPRSMRISAVGFDTPELLSQPTAQKVVHVMPALAGGGGKFGSIIYGAVVFAVGVAVFFIPGAQSIGVALMINGGLMMAQGIVQLFMKSPNLSKNNDPEGSKYLAVNRNTTAVGTPITMAWGTIDLAGHWISLQSDSSNLAFGTFPATPT